MTRVLNEMESWTAIGSLADPCKLIKTVRESLGSAPAQQVPAQRLAAAADSVTDSLAECYVIIHDLYKNKTHTTLNRENNTKKVYHFNRVLEFICESAVRLYDKFGSRPKDTAACLIGILNERHLKLAFDDMERFVSKSLPVYAQFVNSYGSRHDIDEFKRIQDQYFRKGCSNKSK